MKKTVIVCACLSCFVSGQAQDIERIDSLNDINAIKRDTSFIYAESTMKDAVEAQSGAHAILELKLYDWLRSKFPQENSELLVSNSKEKWYDLLSNRGKYNRVFVYVRKSDVIPVLKQENQKVEDAYSMQEKVAFIKRMYKDFFENNLFDKEDLCELQKYLTPDVAKRLRIECPYDGCQGDSSYVVDLFVDGSFSFERPDLGNRVVVRTIKPLKKDWFEVINVWDVNEDSIVVGMKVQNTIDGLRVNDFSINVDSDREEGLSETEYMNEDWELLLSSEEQKMITLVSFYEIEPYIKQLKDDDRIKGYGKYSTMPQDMPCHLFVYNKEGEIVTVLKKTPRNTYNLKNRTNDAISNYKDCGAIWFTLR